MSHPFPVHLLIATPRGPIALDKSNAALPLPRDDRTPTPVIRYGPYLKGLHECLSGNGYARLLQALGSHFRAPIGLPDVTALHITSEKHGALYHVAHLQVQLRNRQVSFALNVAISREQKAFLESDMGVLNALHDRFHLFHLPKVYFQDEALYHETEHPLLPMHLFMAEWFEGYHEFHLSLPPGETKSGIIVWEENGENAWLTDLQTQSLYRHASAILTACLDMEDFRQIYPWHHAAGDFIVRREKDTVSVRLITARDYRCITPQAATNGDRWIGIICFFLNLTIRMRLDRLDGTGALAWAEGSCMKAMVEGFLEAWKEKHGKDPSLPAPGNVLEVFRSFDADEWEDLGNVVLEQGMVEHDEASFLKARLTEHVKELSDAVLKAIEP